MPYFKLLSRHSFVEADKNHEQPQLPDPISLEYKSVSQAGAAVREVSTSLDTNKPDFPAGSTEQFIFMGGE